MEARAFFQSNQFQFELHKALKLFPTGQAIMQFVAEASRQMVVDHRIQADIDSLAGEVRSLTAPAALEERCGKHYLPVDTNQSLTNVCHKLALIRFQGYWRLPHGSVRRF